MYDAPSAPLSLVPVPGARGAKRCGIWSIILSCTCVGIPIGLVLAICALVMSAKARRLAKEQPDVYEPPTATGLVTGIIGLVMPIVMLPFIGIVSAIAIPALLSQRARVEGQRLSQTMKLQTNLLEDYRQMMAASDPALKGQPDEVIQALIAKEQARSPRPANAYDGTFPFEKAPHPSKPGNLSLWPEQDPDMGPVIQVRFTMRVHDQDKEEAIPLPLR